MALELKDFFGDLSRRSLKTIILAAKGKNFCAGADLKERKGMDDGILA